MGKPERTRGVSRPTSFNLIRVISRTFSPQRSSMSRFCRNLGHLPRRTSATRRFAPHRIRNCENDSLKYNAVERHGGRVQMHNAHHPWAAKWSLLLDVINSLLQPLVTPFAPYSSNKDQRSRSRARARERKRECAFVCVWRGILSRVDFLRGGFAAHFPGLLCYPKYTVQATEECLADSRRSSITTRCEKRGAIKGPLNRHRRTTRYLVFVLSPPPQEVAPTSSAWRRVILGFTRSTAPGSRILPYERYWLFIGICYRKKLGWSSVWWGVWARIKSLVKIVGGILLECWRGSWWRVLVDRDFYQLVRNSGNVKRISDSVL